MNSEQEPRSDVPIEARSQELSTTSADLAARGLALLHDASLTRTEKGGWGGRIRDKLLGKGPSPSEGALIWRAFRRAFITATRERLPGASSQAAADLVDAVAPLMSVSGSVGAKESEIIWSCHDLSNTEDSLGDGFFFGTAVILLRTLLEVETAARTVRVVLNGTLLDETRQEQHACILSVEATRETAESFSWQALDDRQILERFDLRFADGMPVVPHASDEPERNVKGRPTRSGMTKRSYVVADPAHREDAGWPEDVDIETTLASWLGGEGERALVRLLNEGGDGNFVIAAARDFYLQFALEGEMGSERTDLGGGLQSVVHRGELNALHVEAVSNASLPPAKRLSKDRIKALEDLQFAVDSQGSNFVLQWYPDASVAAQIAGTVLRDIYGVQPDEPLNVKICFQ